MCAADNVFGCHLDTLCHREHTIIPRFVVKCIKTVEKRGKLAHTRMHRHTRTHTTICCMCSGLDIDGIYRVSGNLAVIQKLRHKADHGDKLGLILLTLNVAVVLLSPPLTLFSLSSSILLWSAEEQLDLEDGQWEEIHVIAGALKLFLRELPEPLFPFSSFDKFIAAIRECTQTAKASLWA